MPIKIVFFVGLLHSVVVVIYLYKFVQNRIKMRKLIFCICIIVPSLVNAQAKLLDIIRSGEVNNTSKIYDVAEKEFNKAYAMIEADLEAGLAKLEAFNKLSEYEKAVKENPISPENKKNYCAILFGRGVARVGLKKNMDALKDFNRVLIIDDKYVPAYYERGLIKLANNDKQSGCLDLRTAKDMGYAKAEEAIKSNACNAEADDYYSKGLDKYRSQRYKEAIQDLDMAIKFNPDSTNYFQRGMCYLKLADYDDAISDFSAAIKMQPAGKSNGTYHLNRGIAYLGLKQYTPAYADLSEAIKADNNSYDAYLNRGIACEGLKDLKGASFDYQNLTRIKPSAGEGYFKLGLVKYDMWLKDEACELFNKANTLGYPGADARVKLCKLRTQSGQKPQ